MLFYMKSLVVLMMMLTAMVVQAWQPVNENAPEPSREFRAAWVTSVFNLDWPSKAGLSAAQQQKEIESIRKKYLPQEVDKMEQLRALHAVPTQKARRQPLRWASSVR
jgi:hypothetical protein